jgi:hypothetical protein
MNLFSKGIFGAIAIALIVKAYLLVQAQSQSPSHVFPVLPIFLVGIAIGILLVTTGRINAPAKSPKEKRGR